MKENSSLTLKQNCLKKKREIKNSSYDFGENEVLLVQIVARVLELWLDTSSGPMGPNCNGANVVHRPQTPRSWNVLKFYNFITFILFF